MNFSSVHAISLEGMLIKFTDETNLAGMVMLAEYVGSLFRREACWDWEAAWWPVGQVWSGLDGRRVLGRQRMAKAVDYYR